jgi:hypothetical protein
MGRVALTLNPDRPDFALFALIGASPVKLSDLRGKTVVLDFWVPFPIMLPSPAQGRPGS